MKMAILKIVVGIGLVIGIGLFDSRANPLYAANLLTGIMFAVMGFIEVSSKDLNRSQSTLETLDDTWNKLYENQYTEMRSAIEGTDQRWATRLKRQEETSEQERTALMELLSDETPVERKSISLALRNKIIKRDHSICSYCGEAGTTQGGPDGLAWNIDHVIPVSRGGRTVPGNLTLSCGTCNSQKKDCMPFEFIRRIAPPPRFNTKKQQMFLLFNEGMDAEQAAKEMGYPRGHATPRGYFREWQQQGGGM